MLDPENISFSETVPNETQEKLLQQISEMVDGCGFCLVNEIADFQEYFIVSIQKYESFKKRMEEPSTFIPEILRIFNKYEK